MTDNKYLHSKTILINDTTYGEHYKCYTVDVLTREILKKIFTEVTDITDGCNNSTETLEQRATVGSNLGLTG